MSTDEGTKPPDRAERRKQAREEDRHRAEEIERLLDQPGLPAFDAPAAGRIVQRPATAAFEPRRPATAAPGATGANDDEDDE